MENRIEHKTAGFFIAFLFITLSAFLLFPVYTHAVTDNQGPMIESLTVDKSEYKPGDTITFTLKLQDGSQISTYPVKPSAAFTLVNSQDTIIDGLHFDKVNDYTFSCTYTVTDKNVDGSYHVFWVSASDEYGNKTVDSNIDCSFTIIGGVSDNQGPVIESLTVDKSEYKPGDTITFTLKLQDGSQISTYPVKPSAAFTLVNSQDTIIDGLHFDKVNDYTFSCTYTVTDKNVDGSYHVFWVSASDEYGNKTVDSNVDCSFTIIGGISDNQGPVIESLTVDKSEYKPGDTITFTLKLQDGSQISTYPVKPSAAFTLVNSQDTIIDGLHFDKVNDYTFSCTYTVTDKNVDGGYHVFWVSASDEYGNKTVDSNVDCSFTIYSVQDYDQFSGIQMLERITVINTDRTITNNTILGDLYIAPNSIATLNNVVVTGNIYVLGTLRAISISANALHARNMFFGDFAYGNGAVSMSGSNSVDSMSVGGDVISEVPHRFDTEFVAIDNTISVKGAFANIATMYINDVRVNSTSSGKFYLNDLDVSNTNSIIVKFITSEGKEFIKEYNIEKGTLDGDGKINIIPSISAKDIIACKGSMINLLDGITAYDKEDGDITNRIIVSPTSISTESAKSYEVIYSVEDSKGAKISKAITVKVKEHNYGEWKTTKEATCTEDGSKEKVCADCGDKVTETIKTPGHQWNTEYTVDKAATCTEDGSKSIHCAICGAKDESTVTVIPKTGHDWNEPAYAWSDDNSTVTATHICRNDISHKELEIVKSTSEVTKAATYAEKGETTYTAVFKNSTFTVQTKIVQNIPKLIVKNTTLSKVKAAKKGFTVKWKKGTGINGYEIQYALNSKFTKSKKTVRITKAKTVSKKITKLKAKKEYYIRICTYKTISGKKYYSTWSKIKTVTTKK